MAHYAFIDENSIVTEVITGLDENDLETLPSEFNTWEEFYGNFRGQTCIRTSYNTFGNEHKDGGTPYRGNFAGIGYIYDPIEDVFYQPQPFNSWTISIDSNWLWKAPLDKPELTQEEIDNNNYYEWDEDLYLSDNTLGWVLR